MAKYAYDAYGNTLSATGVQASSNTYRFSTKEQMSNGLYNYGYRFYSPGMGRWINRDPIAEAGGLNLYAAMDNSPINAVDAYGLVVDTPWDAFNVGLGAASLLNNLIDGEYGWAVVDAVGMVVDVTATAVPFIPGGAATGLQVLRVGNKVVAVAGDAASLAGDVSKARSLLKAVDESGNMSSSSGGKIDPCLNKTAESLISGTGKRSKSYFGELAGKTKGELIQLGKGRGEQANRAGKMLKLIKESERTNTKVKSGMKRR